MSVDPAQEPKQPQGDLVIRTIAMPCNTNRYHDIFGGWLVSQMDLGGAIKAFSCSHNRMTTVAIDKMVFIRPVYVGDVVSCYAGIKKQGRTSVTISVEAWVTRHDDNSFHQVTKGDFTFVAINEGGRPVPISWKDD